MATTQNNVQDKNASKLISKAEKYLKEISENSSREDSLSILKDIKKSLLSFNKKDTSKSKEYSEKVTRERVEVKPEKSNKALLNAISNISKNNKKDKIEAPKKDKLLTDDNEGLNLDKDRNSILNNIKDALVDSKPKKEGFISKIIGMLPVLLGGVFSGVMKLKDLLFSIPMKLGGFVLKGILKIPNMIMSGVSKIIGFVMKGISALKAFILKDQVSDSFDLDGPDSKRKSKSKLPKGKPKGKVAKVFSVVKNSGSKAVKAAGSVGTKVASVGAKAGSSLLRVGAAGAKALPGIGLAITAGMAIKDGFDGWNNAAEILGKKAGETVTTGEKMKAASASALSGLTFGLVSTESMVGGIDKVSGAFSWVGSKIADGFGSAKNSAFKAADKAKELLGDAANYARNKLGSAKDAVVDGFSNAKDAAYEGLNNAKMFLVEHKDQILGFLTKFGSIVLNIINPFSLIVKSMKKLVNWIKESEVVKKAISMVTGLFDFGDKEPEAKASNQSSKTTQNSGITTQQVSQMMASFEDESKLAKISSLENNKLTIGSDIKDNEVRKFELFTKFMMYMFSPKVSTDIVASMKNMQENVDVPQPNFIITPLA